MAKNNLTHDLKKQLVAFKNLVQKQLPEHAAMKLEDKYNQSFEQESNAFKPSGKWASREPAKNRDTERGQGTLSRPKIGLHKISVKWKDIQA